MPVRTLLLPLLCLCLAVAAQGQDFTSDSIALMGPKLVRLQAKTDNRVTFYEGQSLFLSGYDAGVMLKDKLRIALGYSGLNEDLNAFKETIDSVDVGPLIKIDYGTLNIELNYLDTRYFSLGLPLELGVGWNRLSFKNFTTDQIYKVEEGLIALSHFGLSGTFKPIPWFGLKGLVGYRKMLYNQVKEFDFNGFFTAVGFSVDIREIITDVKMYKLMKGHKRGNRLGNAVDLLVN